MANELLQLLKNALLSGRDDARLVQEVRARAREVREALGAGDIDFTPDEVKQLEAHPDRVAALFDMLAEPGEPSGRELEVEEAIAQARGAAERSIADAFQVLLDPLPPSYRQWDRHFKGVPDAPPRVQEALRAEAAVAESAPYSDGLIRYGLSPAVFVEAARGVQLLLDRLLHAARAPERDDAGPAGLSEFNKRVRACQEVEGLPHVVIVLGGQTPPGSGHPVVPYGLLVAQVRGTPQCPPAAAEPLLRWLVLVAQLRPLLFPGYRARTLTDQSIRLSPERVGEAIDWVLRWGWSGEDPVDEDLPDLFAELEAEEAGALSNGELVSRLFVRRSFAAREPVSPAESLRAACEALRRYYVRLAEKAASLPETVKPYARATAGAPTLREAVGLAAPSGATAGADPAAAPAPAGAVPADFLGTVRYSVGTVREECHAIVAAEACWELLREGDPQLYDIALLSHLGERTVNEVAEVVGVSPALVKKGRELLGLTRPRPAPAEEQTVAPPAPQAAHA